jgi:hypothetical protein
MSDDNEAFITGALLLGGGAWLFLTCILFGTPWVGLLGSVAGLIMITIGYIMVEGDTDGGRYT